MNEPATERAVHTTPPITRAAIIPLTPLSPTPTITTEARISVMSVIPDTGLLPTIAIALAATVVNRNEIPATRIMATSACSISPSITPSQKNTKVSTMVTIEAIAMNLNERSRPVRTVTVSSLLPPFISLAASPTALLMIPHDFTIPMIPAIAIPPIPIDLP